MPKFIEVVDGTWINLDKVATIVIEAVLTPDNRPTDPNTAAVLPDSQVPGPKPTGHLRIVAVTDVGRIAMAVKPDLEEAKLYINNLSN